VTSQWGHALSSLPTPTQPRAPIQWAIPSAQNSPGNQTIIYVSSAPHWPSSTSGTRLMVQKPRFAQKSKNCSKSMSLPLAACAVGDNLPREYTSELFQPSKDSRSPAVCTEKKTLEIWVWGFRWMSSGLGYVLLFLVIILWRHHPDNEPKLWLKVWLYSRLWYEASEGFFSRGEHQGCSGVGTAFPHLFLACERVPTPFCTSNVTWGCGIRKITLKHGRDLTDELATRRFVYTVKQKDPVWKFL